MTQVTRQQLSFWLCLGKFYNDQTHWCQLEIDDQHTKCGSTQLYMENRLLHLFNLNILWFWYQLSLHMAVSIQLSKLINLSLSLAWQANILTWFGELEKINITVEFYHLAPQNKWASLNTEFIEVHR